MRTIRRQTAKINLGKQGKVVLIAKAYAKEKQHWLQFFQNHANVQYVRDARKIRNKAVKEKYKSPHGLQGRMWKLALQDAADTMDRYWKSLFDNIKKNIFLNRSFSKEQKHYAYWLLCDYGRLQAALNFSYPKFKEIAWQERKKVVTYLNKQIRKYKKQYPKVKIARSFAQDANCYEIYTHKEKQYIKIMTLTKNKRIALPLLGSTPIQGNIRIVIDDKHCEIHYTADIKKEKQENQEVLGVDFGYTEAFTDSEGTKTGQSFGKIMTESSDVLKGKMQKRHKLHALAKKYQNDPKKQKKANNIRRYNLGHIKFNARQKRIRASLAQEINTACNQIFNKNYGILVTEDLSHSFKYTKGRNWNRRLSSWVRGSLKERVSFKALVKGFDHEQVNPAYSSQTCTECDYVGPGNRTGDRFQCQYCGHVDDADRVAAKNLKRRRSDPKITRYTPYREVKRILLERFHRRLETEKSGTVRGRILDTAINEPTICGQSESECEKHSVYI